MSTTDQKRKDIDDAVALVSRAVRRARNNGGAAGQEQFDRLVREWPELARALSRLLLADGTVRPDQWRGLRRPEAGWRWEG